MAELAEKPNERPNPLDIIQTTKPLPLRICMNGQPGVGKSTFASEAPNPIFILTEEGLGDITVDAFPLCRRLSDVYECIYRLKENEHDYKTVVLDSLDWCQDLIYDEVCARHNVQSIEDANGGFGKGYVEVAKEWRKLFAKFDELRIRCGMQIIFTAHTEVRRLNDPRLPSYDAFEIKLNKRGSAIVEEYCDVILFATWDVTVKVSKDPTSGQKRAMALEDAPRVMYTNLSPLYKAKNRYHLPDQLPLSYSAFERALKESRARRANNQ